jgi:thiamine biosynthesis lipoprotein
MIELATASWKALGTTASVVCDAGALGRARCAVETELSQIDASCSRFRQDSELTRLNEAAGRPTAVGPLLFEAVVTALRAAEISDSAVDPTIGRALVLSGYDRDFSQGLEEPARPLSVKRVSGWRSVSIDFDQRRITLPRGVQLDLGATAKALAADRAAKAATAVTDGSGVLVNLGGDIAVAGQPPEDGWHVRVADDHRAPPDAPGQALRIHAGGLATSSTTVRRWGRSSHHIIDPQTGLAANSRWRTVSAAAASCVDANTASTAAIVRGDDAPAWLEELGIPARFVDRDGEVVVVADWPAECAAA